MFVGFDQTTPMKFERNCWISDEEDEDKKFVITNFVKPEVITDFKMEEDFNEAEKYFPSQLKDTDEEDEDRLVIDETSLDKPEIMVIDLSSDEEQEKSCQQQEESPKELVKDDNEDSRESLKIKIVRYYEEEEETPGSKRKARKSKVHKKKVPQTEMVTVKSRPANSAKVIYSTAPANLGTTDSVAYFPPTPPPSDEKPVPKSCLEEEKVLQANSISELFDRFEKTESDGPIAKPDLEKSPVTKTSLADKDIKKGTVSRECRVKKTVAKEKKKDYCRKKVTIDKQSSENLEEKERVKKTVEVKISYPKIPKPVENKEVEKTSSEKAPSPKSNVPEAIVTLPVEPLIVMSEKVPYVAKRPSNDSPPGPPFKRIRHTPLRKDVENQEMIENLRKNIEHLYKFYTLMDQFPPYSEEMEFVSQLFGNALKTTKRPILTSFRKFKDSCAPAVEPVSHLASKWSIPPSIITCILKICLLSEAQQNDKGGSDVPEVTSPVTSGESSVDSTVSSPVNPVQFAATVARSPPTAASFSATSPTSTLRLNIQVSPHAFANQGLSKQVGTVFPVPTAQLMPQPAVAQMNCNQHASQQYSAAQASQAASVAQYSQPQPPQYSAASASQAASVAQYSQQQPHQYSATTANQAASVAQYSQPQPPQYSERQISNALHYTRQAPNNAEVGANNYNYYQNGCYNQGQNNYQPAGNVNPATNRVASSLRVPPTGQYVNSVNQLPANYMYPQRQAAYDPSSMTQPNCQRNQTWDQHISNSIKNYNQKTSTNPVEVTQNLRKQLQRRKSDNVDTAVPQGLNSRPQQTTNAMPVRVGMPRVSPLAKVQIDVDNMLKTFFENYINKERDMPDLGEGNNDNGQPTRQQPTKAKVVGGVQQTPGSTSGKALPNNGNSQPNRPT